MFLVKDGIMVEFTHPSDIKHYKGLGFVEAEIGYPNPEIIKNGVKENGKVTIAQIYAMCEKAGVSPDDLKLEHESPTLAEVKAAIKAAQKDGEQ